jgi:hypothetical protein
MDQEDERLRKTSNDSDAEEEQRIAAHIRQIEISK